MGMKQWQLVFTEIDNKYGAAVEVKRPSNNVRAFQDNFGELEFEKQNKVGFFDSVEIVFGEKR